MWNVWLHLVERLVSQIQFSGGRVGLVQSNLGWLGEWHVKQKYQEIPAKCQNPLQTIFFSLTLLCWINGPPQKKTHNNKFKLSWTKSVGHLITSFLVPLLPAQRCFQNLSSTGAFRIWVVWSLLWRPKFYLGPWIWKDSEPLNPGRSWVLEWFVLALKCSMLSCETVARPSRSRERCCACCFLTDLDSGSWTWESSPREELTSHRWELFLMGAIWISFPNP